jgi:hypothetical protein
VLEARDRGLRRPGQVRELLLREAELRAALGHSVGDLSEEPAVLRAGDAPAEAFERLGCVPAVLISHVCYNSIRAMTVKTLIPLAILVLATAAGCGGDPEPKAAPDLRGERLDVAERRLDELGLDFERVGGGAFGIVVRSNWQVCRQEPAPGKRTTEVRLVVARWCPPPPPVERVVPDLAGTTLRQAERRLEALELPYTVESLDGLSPAPSRSRVCDQSPGDGVRAARVTLFVAGDCDPPPPSPPRPPLAPDLRGSALDDAKAELDALGLGWSVVPSGQGPVVDALWEVCAQTPPGGSRTWHVTLHARDDC